jgi:four helix bundle protein
MMELKHKNLDCWKMSIDFVTSIYKVTSQLPSNEIYGLTSQLRRAAVSVSSNLAEGASRPTAVDRKHFFIIARSSLVEIDTQLEICKRLNYLSEYSTLSEQLNHLFAALSKLIEKT